MIRAGDLEVDVDRHRVLRADEPIELTPTEFKILVTLMRAADRVLSARQIVTAVWGSEYADDTDYIRRYVWHLRQKLERDPRSPAVHPQRAQLWLPLRLGARRGVRPTWCRGREDLRGVGSRAAILLPGRADGGHPLEQSQTAPQTGRLAGAIRVRCSIPLRHEGE